MSGTVPILGVASAGRGSQDERRLRLLLAGLEHTVASVDRDHGRLRGITTLLRLMWRHRRELVLIEGTGVVAGLPAIAVSLATGGRFRYLVSSGDAVGPYVRMKAGPVLGFLAGRYERTLYRRSFAFLGWTPYFVGRALHLGAPRGLTIPGFAVVAVNLDPGARDRIRSSWGVPEGAFVVGVVGSINAPDAHGYGYGTELVGVSELLEDDDVRFVVVGDGPGLERLRAAAAQDPRFVFTGRVDAEEVPAQMQALDASLISQTHDLVGGMRWTTKLPELLACGVPCIVSGTPAFLDLAEDPLVHVLPEAAPGSQAHLKAAVRLLTSIRDSPAQTSTTRRSVDPVSLTPERARDRLLLGLVTWGITPSSDAAGAAGN